MKEGFSSLRTRIRYFGHANILKYCSRPWPDVESMNEGLVERWNSRVGPEDTVYHLGDFAMGGKGNLKWRRRLNGKIILIKGNHDWSKKIMLEAGFDEVHKSKTLYLPDEKVRIHLAHIPTHIPEGPNRPQRTYSPSLIHKLDLNAYDYLLCGHVHQDWGRNGKTINVGVDVSDFYPLTFAELLERDNPKE